MMKRIERPLLLLLAVFGVVFVGNLDSVRYVSEDWYLLPTLRDVMGSGPLGFMRVFFHDRSRILGVSHLADAFFVWLFGFAHPVPAFLFLQGAHALSCLLVYRLLDHWTRDREFAAAAALACLLMPTAATCVFYINHTFFILPVTFLLAMAYVYVFPLEDRRLDLCALTALATLGQFSGEQPALLYYCVFLAAAFSAVRASPADRTRLCLRALVPAAASAGCLVTRFALFMAPSLKANDPGQHAPPWFIIMRFVRMHRQALDMSNWLFGGFTLSVSPRTACATLMLAGLIGAYFWTTRDESSTPAPLPVRKLLFGSLAGDLLCLPPILLAAAKGYRYNVEPRYLYVSGFFMSIAICAAIDAVSRRLGSLGPRSRSLAFAGMTLYAGFLMQYSAHDIWGTQKRVDERIWSAITDNLGPRVRYLMLDGMAPRSMTPGQWSAAFSDFQADDGAVADELHETLRRTVTVVRRLDMRLPRDGTIQLRNFSRSKSFKARPNEILAIVFRHGPTFAALDQGLVAAFPNFDDYIQFRIHQGYSLPGG